jgi:CheY-like chemotaxis protein
MQNEFWQSTKNRGQSPAGSRAPITSTIMIASDCIGDAAQVQDLLNPEFDHIYISTGSDKVPGDFVRYRPSILVLAFDTLEKAESYFLELYRLCEEVRQQPLRTVILCNRSQINQVYELCKKEFFDDYILFWPMSDDSSRLAMTIHHALHDLAALKTAGPSKAEFAAQARHLAELENTLDRQIVEGGMHIKVASLAVENAAEGVGAALDGFSQRIISGALPDTVEVKNAEGLKNEISRFKREEVQPHFKSAIEITQPLKQWAEKFKQECEPFLQSARALNAMAECIQPTVLVVDDDEAQRIIIDKLLTANHYNLLFARDGFEALSILRNKRPDLILMDIMMPNMNGMETTRRLKDVPEFAGTPVIMITGRSEEEMVVDSMKSGAVDFVVKPFDHNLLVAKIKHALDTAIPT